MKKVFVLAIVAGLAGFVSCQKQQTEAEKNAEIDRRVQERLAAEQQASQQQQLDQRQADLDAREKALAEKENATATPEQERRPVAPRREREEYPSGAQTAGYSTFYTNLEPYGSWIETNDYGYVWQPREAESSRSWRPYTDGRWVYTDAGWTWISRERFGWATYHYGRWTRLRGIGWVWVPGEQWAPAWVSWRKSKDYVGWAPLPPEARFERSAGIHNWADNYYDIGPDQYCFVPTQQFGTERVESVVVPSQQNVTIVNETTNVTNITYNNTTIVNEGPSYDELRSESREPLQRYRLERSAEVSSQPESAVVRGETVVVAAPAFVAPQRNERPPTVKQNVAQVTVDLGWEGISDREAAKKAREKMKSEAAPPSNAPPKKFVRAEAATTAPAESTGGTSASTPSATTSSAAPTFTPRRTFSAAQSPTPAASASAVSSAFPSPSAAERRGRLLVPATPTPRITPFVPPTKSEAAANSPSPSATIARKEFATPSPLPSLTPNAGTSPQGPRQGRFQSQAQRFQPRKIEPMPSGSPSATPGGASPKPGGTAKTVKIPIPGTSPEPSARSTSPTSAASTSSPSPVEKLTKQEKKEQKREEKQELKRERREGLEKASPSPATTP